MDEDGAGDGCWGGFEASAAKGSGDIGWVCENEGTGVFDREAG